MILTPYQRDVYSAKICPYCNSKTVTVTQEVIYGKVYDGKIMFCCKNFPRCDAYVRTHEEDGSPLGRLANKRLRIFKKDTHFHFDKLWEEGLCSRTEAYAYLSKYLNIPVEYTHIGMFNIKTCKEAMDWSIKTYQSEINNIKNKSNG